MSSGFILDLKQAFRSFLRTPLSTAAMVLTLALGIGATTAMFSAVHGLLLRPLPYPEPDRLVALYDARRHGTETHVPLSVPGFFDYRERSRSFEGLAAYDAYMPSFSGSEGCVRLRAGRTTAGFFELLRVKPLLGRFYGSSNETPGEHRVAVLTYQTWQSRFGGEPSAVGRTMVLDGEAFTIMGVVPAAFAFPFSSFTRAEVELFVPIPRPHGDEGYGNRMLAALARLKPGVPLESGEKELQSIAAEISRTHADDGPPFTARVYELRQDWLGDQTRPLLMLMSAVGFLLLIACVNVANLLLTRAESRRREAAVRTSLGASPRQLFSHFLADGLVLGLLGGCIGVVLARVGLFVLPGVLPRAAEIHQVQELRLDFTVLAFAWLVTLACSLAFAAAPFLQASRRDLQRALAETGRGSSGREWLRSSLVVAQVSLSALLLVSVGLFLRSFLKVLDQDLGFEPRGACTFSVTLPESRFPDVASQYRFNERLIARLAALPGVDKAGVTLLPPLTGSDMGTGAVPVEQVGDPEARSGVSLDAVSPGYVEALRIPVLRGRAIGPQDTATSRPIVLINDALARRFYPGSNPVGKVLDVAIPQPSGQSQDSEASPWEIVGVLKDTRDRRLETAPKPRVLVPLSQAFTCPDYSYVLRTDLPMPALESSVREIVAEIDPQLAIGRMRKLEEGIGDLLGTRRRTLALLSTFAILALLLTAIGVYGVVSFSVASRTREIGTRMAFGAQVTDIVKMVMGRGVRLVTFGLALGIAGALALGRFIASQLYGVQPTDPFTLVAVGLVLSTTACLASLAPSLRAALLDPAVALRSE